MPSWVKLGEENPCLRMTVTAVIDIKRRCVPKSASEKPFMSDQRFSVFQEAGEWAVTATSRSDGGVVEGCRSGWRNKSWKKKRDGFEKSVIKKLSGFSSRFQAVLWVVMAISARGGRLVKMKSVISASATGFAVCGRSTAQEPPSVTASGGTAPLAADSARLPPLWPGDSTLMARCVLLLITVHTVTYTVPFATKKGI